MPFSATALCYRDVVSRRHQLVGFAVAVALFSCVSCEPVRTPKTATKTIVNAPLLELTSAREPGGFEDVILAIQEYEDRPSEVAITASATHQARRVSVRIVLIKGMTPGLRGTTIDRKAFFVGGVRLESVGAESDAFVSELAAIYGITTPTKMRQSVLFTAFPLQGDPTELLTQHLNFKVFHDEDDSLGEYSEAYVHVDIPHRYIRLDEKDPEYRAPLLKALSQEPAG